MKIKSDNLFLRFAYYCLVFLLGMVTGPRRDEDDDRAVHEKDAFGNEAIMPTPEMEELMPVHGLNRQINT